MTSWIALLATATLVVIWVIGVVDLVRRRDLPLVRKLLWGAVIVLVPTAGAALYVLARPVPVDRTVVGAPAEGVVPVPTGVGRRGARVVQQASRFAARGLFRSVEVVRPAAVATSGPQLWIASHFGAFSDPIVLLHALERQPRFLAAKWLFRPPLSWVLHAVGAIPVARRQDGDGDNRAMFAAARAALRAGDALCIFPEGQVSETTSMAPLRTGAARIALGARADGTTGLQVVPVGIHYRDRSALRQRVYVDIGEPFDLDTWLRERGLEDADDRADRADRADRRDDRADRRDDRADRRAVDDTDRDLVRALTDDLDVRLREVAPEFADLDEAVALLAAASVALRRPGGPDPTWGQRADLADELGRRPLEQRREIVATAGAYRSELDAAGVTDQDVVGRPERSRRHVLWLALAGVLLLPVALVGAVIHAPFAAVVRATRRLPVSAATKATVRPSIAIVLALVTWLVVAWLVTGDVSGAQRVGAFLGWVVVLPAWGFVALVVGERVASLRDANRWRRRRLGTDVVASVRADRDRIVALVADASGSVPPRRPGDGGR